MAEKDQVRQLLSMAMAARTQLNEFTSSVREVFGHAAEETSYAAASTDYMTLLEAALAGRLSSHSNSELADADDGVVPEVA